MKPPRSLEGRIEPKLTIEQVRKRIALDRALRPQLLKVTREEFDQIVYDRAASDRTASRAAVLRWAKRHYRVIEELK